MREEGYEIRRKAWKRVIDGCRARDRIVARNSGGKDNRIHLGGWAHRHQGEQAESRFKENQKENRAGPKQGARWDQG